MDDSDRKAAKKLIFRRLNNSSIHLTTLSNLRTPQTTTTTKLNALQKLAAVCGRILPTSTTTRATMTLDEEISTYIKSAISVENFQEFWMEHGKQLPRLANLVRTVNIIPATSISSEALFSVASYINRKQRSSLSSQTIRYLLVLKNKHLIDQLAQHYS
jgi:hypothetical protein